MKDAIAAVDVAGRGQGRSTGRGVHQGGRGRRGRAGNVAGAHFLGTAAAAGLPNQRERSRRGALGVSGGHAGRGGARRPKRDAAVAR